MSKLIGEPEIHEDALKQMRERGGKWAAYQNHAMDDSDIGSLRFLQYGDGCTFKEAPPKYPDTQFGTGWRFLLVGSVNLEEGTIEEEKT